LRQAGVFPAKWTYGRTSRAPGVGLRYDYALQYTITVLAIGRIEELADLAAELGLQRDDGIRSLSVDEYLADVRSDNAMPVPASDDEPTAPELQRVGEAELRSALARFANIRRTASRRSSTAGSITTRSSCEAAARR